MRELPPELGMDAEWVIQNVGYLLRSEQIQIRDYWFKKWNFETGTDSDRIVYELTQSKIDVPHWAANVVFGISEVIDTKSKQKTRMTLIDVGWEETYKDDT